LENDSGKEYSQDKFEEVQQRQNSGKAANIGNLEE